MSTPAPNNNRMDDPDEVLYLVDEHDQPIGSIQREEITQLETSERGFTRSVGVFVINDKGELWTPRRNEHKRIAPGGLDAGAAEHVGHGEPYLDAAVRGLAEELNITAQPDELTEIGTVPPFKGVPYFHKVYVYHSNEAPPYGSDYTGFEWLTPTELAGRLKAGEPAKDVLLPSVQLLLDNQSTTGVQQ